MNSTLIIGSGPSATYYLKHRLDQIRTQGLPAEVITIVEKALQMGAGMPWSRGGAEHYHLANIAAENIPPLPQTMAAWLQEQDGELLKTYQVTPAEADGTGLYPRLLVGRYFEAQFALLVAGLRSAGCTVHLRNQCQITDVRPHQSGQAYLATCREGEDLSAQYVVIATGHLFENNDRAKEGFFSPPWPISKVIAFNVSANPPKIGILGASLSAFDAVSAIARQHGEFVRGEGARATQLIFRPFEEASCPVMIMHSAEGWLPHLEFEQEKTTRKKDKYADGNFLSKLQNEQGFLRLQSYFDQVCRPHLLEAALADNLPELASILARVDSGFKELIAHLSAKHRYDDPFAGMREEVKEGLRLKRTQTATKWKEVFDDLLYCLNFHTEKLCAEDHEELHGSIIPFFLNVVAGMPIQSAEILLALNEAQLLRLHAGRVTIDKSTQQRTHTSIQIKTSQGAPAETLTYEMFVDCTGQDSINFENFPFRTLAEKGLIRSATARYAGEDRPYANKTAIPGLDISASYRLVAQTGEPNERLFDVAFSHTLGARPYSYGLQSCSDATEVVARELGQKR